MTKTLAVLVFIIAVCSIAVHAVPPSRKPAAINIENVLGNDRLLNGYIRCLMDEGPCSRDGKNLKQLLPDAIQTDCSSCTGAQKQNSRKVITFFRTHRPQDWKRLSDKFDPHGNFKGTRQ